MDRYDLTRVNEISMALEAVSGYSYNKYKSTINDAKWELKAAQKEQKRGEHSKAIEHCNAGIALIEEFKQYVGGMSDAELHKFSPNVSELLGIALKGLALTVGLSGMVNNYKSNKVSRYNGPDAELYARNEIDDGESIGECLAAGGIIGTAVVAIRSVQKQMKASRESMIAACDALIQSFEAIKEVCGEPQR